MYPWEALEEGHLPFRIESAVADDLSCDILDSPFGVLMRKEELLVSDAQHSWPTGFGTHAEQPFHLILKTCIEHSGDAPLDALGQFFRIPEQPDDQRVHAVSCFGGD